MADTTKSKATSPIQEENPWDIKCKIRLPKSNNGEGNYLIASVNGRVFKVMRGVDVEVPLPIARVIENSFDAENDADVFIEKLTK